MSEAISLNLLANPPKLEGTRIEMVESHHLKVSGTLRERDAAALLGAYFREVHLQAIRQRQVQVLLDVSELTFVSASAFRLFLDWTSWILENGKPYKLRVLTSRLVAWQKTSLPSIAALAENVFDIERVD